jgi:gliding motility-associated-like protein
MSFKGIALFGLFLGMPFFVSAQWSFKNDLGEITYSYNVPEGYLLTKVKYTSQHQADVLFNYVNRQTQNYSTYITMDGISRDGYKYNLSNATHILRESQNNFIHGGELSDITINGTSASYPKDFEIDPNDNFIVLSDNMGNNWSGSVNVAANTIDSTQILLYKVDQQSNIIWYKLYGGSNADYAVSINKSLDGNFFVLAETQSSDEDVKLHYGGKDIWLLKIDGNNGNILWQKTFGTDKDEVPRHLEVLNDGGLVISGSADQSSLFPSSYTGKNSFLMKLDDNGNIIWTKVFGGNGDDEIKTFRAISDGFVSVGTSTSSNGDYPDNIGQHDIYIFKHDVNGNIVWRKHYGSVNDDYAGDISYTECDDKIFASFAKQFSNDKQYYSTPPYPLYSQSAGVQIGLYNKSGNEFYYFEDNFGYSTQNDTYYFNNEIYSTMAANDRGGFLGGSFKHWRYGSGTSLAFLVGRSFGIKQFGYPLTEVTYDTSLCSSEMAWGKYFSRDTSYSDTLRNACAVDTSITHYNIRVTNTSDSTIMKDTTICYGQTLNGATIVNSFVQEDSVLVVTKCGAKKIFTITNFNVPSKDVINLGNDTSVCQAIILDATFNGIKSYLWEDGSTNATINADKSGLYWVQAIDSAGCKTTDSIYVNISDLYLSVVHDTTVSSGQSVTLSPSTNGKLTWEFNSILNCSDCQIVVAQPLESTTLYVKSEKDGCVLNDSVNIIIEKQSSFFIPSAFTPNNDGLNDFFKPSANAISDYKIKIFNRWGQLLFQTTNVLEGWDGKVNGIPQPIGTYTYFVIYKDENMDKKQSQKGTFLLIR